MLLLTALLPVIGLTGCKPGASDFSGSSTAAASLEAPVPDAEQAGVKQVVTQFAAAVQQADDTLARKNLTPRMASATPNLRTWKEGGVYAPLLGAKDWQFNLIRYAGRGKTIVVHTTFKGADGGNYRTNFGFKKPGSKWLIDQIPPPTKPILPTQNTGQMSPK